MNANVYGTVNLLHLDSVRDALEERDKRIAELEAINSSMADDLCSMTGAYERAEQLEERVRELEAENERLRELMTNRPTTLSAWDNAILDRAERAEAENKALRDKLAELATLNTFPAMSDFDVIANYLPPEGHPQDVKEDDCPYCALRRIETELAALKGRWCEACRFDHCEIYRAARWPREREDFGCAAWTERGTE